MSLRSKPVLLNNDKFLRRRKRKERGKKKRRKRLKKTLNTKCRVLDNRIRRLPLLSNTRNNKLQGVKGRKRSF